MHLRLLRDAQLHLRFQMRLIGLSGFAQFQLHRVKPDRIAFLRVHGKPCAERLIVHYHGLKRHLDALPLIRAVERDGDRWAAHFPVESHAHFHLAFAFDIGAENVALAGVEHHER